MWPIVLLNSQRRCISKAAHKFSVLKISRFWHLESIGWGRTVGGGQGANILQQAMLPVADDRRCQSVNGRLGRVYSDTMICAGGQGRGGCQVSITTKAVYITNMHCLLCPLTCRETALRISVSVCLWIPSHNVPKMWFRVFTSAPIILLHVFLAGFVTFPFVSFQLCSEVEVIHIALFWFSKVVITTTSTDASIQKHNEVFATWVTYLTASSSLDFQLLADYLCKQVCL